MGKLHRLFVDLEGQLARRRNDDHLGRLFLVAAQAAAAAHLEQNVDHRNQVGRLQKKNSKRNVEENSSLCNTLSIPISPPLLAEDDIHLISFRPSEWSWFERCESHRKSISARIVMKVTRKNCETTQTRDVVRIDL